MPNVWTHILFGNRTAEEGGFKPAGQEKTAYQLGCQGPDPFFYHRFFPWQKDGAAVIGDRIHHKYCGSFLMDMIEDGMKTDILTKAYIGGFVTHHILDRTAHPYINYRAGTEGNRHQKLEIIIDTLLMKRYRKIETYKTPVYKEIDLGPDLYPEIEELLAKLIEFYFPEEHSQLRSGYINDSYRDMIRALKVLYDPSGIKNRLLGKMIEPFSYQKDLPEGDFLNEKKKEWIHPAAEEETYTASFEELMEHAEEEASRILKVIQLYWLGDQTLYPRLKELIGNISYDTGKSCEGSYENRIFDPIL
ncbi:zinc dependent phospholipase C family protein [Bacillus marinisedimentorum]|uniref:zinc dependent phospholipase C family protein n=1 Tax=Bacillus marinisedimentorum TaxID=1821260 RepID=UPI0008731F6D|nr:zinc dependent phospholipase C family protein [Bacillus marinisedimentorum]